MTFMDNISIALLEIKFLMINLHPQSLIMMLIFWGMFWVIFMTPSNKLSMFFSFSL